MGIFASEKVFSGKNALYAADKLLCLRLLALELDDQRIVAACLGFKVLKSIVCDDCRAVVGTINFDYRSLYHHFENAVYFTHKQAVLAVKNQVIVYTLVGESGPDHEKSFLVEVSINDHVVGRGSGRSKQRAEQDAARVAIEKLYPNE